MPDVLQTEGITITGCGDVINWMETFPKEIVLLGFFKALSAAIQVFESELRIKTPIRKETLWNDETFSEFSNIIGGALRAALVHNVVLDSQYRGGYSEVGYGKLGYIANFVEFGHAKVIYGKHIGHVPAHPFMRSAFDAVNQEAIDAFASVIAQTIDTMSIKNG